MCVRVSAISLVNAPSGQALAETFFGGPSVVFWGEEETDEETEREGHLAEAALAACKNKTLAG